MRIFWLWLMICLLPLRALAGDAMAIQMQQSAFAATEQAQAMPAPDAPGCHGQLHASSPTPEAMPQLGAMHHDGSEHGTAGHATLCLVCDVCHSTATLSPEPPIVAASPAANVPAHVRGPISSAERLPLHKPPIS